jgi:S-adenosylmethionine:tRNA ribosyltransferase-isomerase
VIAADRAIQRSPEAKLLAIDSHGDLRHVPRESFVEFLRPGDLLVANDAATLPASLQGTHVLSGSAIEVRLAGRRSLHSTDVSHFVAIIFGAGDYHTRTEKRPIPPPLMPGDRLALGPLAATIADVLGHPRLVSLHFDGSPDAIWAGIARHGRPIQYAHIAAPLALWDVWTPIAGAAVAFEPPSAGFTLDWRLLMALRARDIHFVTITHAAGISSTGDTELDKRLPFEEPYEITTAAAEAIALTRAQGGRIVAIGTTVVRALEHAATRDGIVRAGPGLATQRITAASQLAVVDVILSGIHEPGTSHYELLRAFADEGVLNRADQELASRGYRTHEFGDSILIERRQTALLPQGFSPVIRSRVADGWRIRCRGRACC